MAGADPKAEAAALAASAELLAELEAAEEKQRRTQAKSKPRPGRRRLAHPISGRKSSPTASPPSVASVSESSTSEDEQDEDGGQVAVGETVILLRNPRPLVGVSTVMPVK